jgi:hypothetical protein
VLQSILFGSFQGSRIGTLTLMSGLSQLPGHIPTGLIDDGRFLWTSFHDESRSRFSKVVSACSVIGLHGSSDPLRSSLVHSSRSRRRLLVCRTSTARTIPSRYNRQLLGQRHWYGPFRQLGCCRSGRSECFRSS